MRAIDTNCPYCGRSGGRGFNFCNLAEDGNFSGDIMDFRMTLFSGSPPYSLEAEVIRAFPDVSFSQETFDFLRNGMSLVNLSDAAYFLGVAIIGFTRMRDVSIGDAAFLSDFLDYLDVNGRAARMSKNQLIAESIAKEKQLFQKFSEGKKKVAAKFLTAIKDSHFFELKEDAIKSALEFWEGQLDPRKNQGERQ